MRLGILSDIHANKAAFLACMARLEREGFDQLAILGDIVGYGPDPGFAVDLTMELAARGAIVVRGNHDQAIGDLRETMSANAKTAIEWTRRQLDATQAGFLAALPFTAKLVDVLLTHANAWAPADFGYMRTTRDAERNLQCTDAHLTLCGHTHVPALFYAAPMRPAQAFAPTSDVAIPLSSRLRWVAVMGACGQPRDGNPGAGCGVYDVTSRRLTLHRVPYDVDETARRIRAAGLPDALAERLSKGR